MLLLLYLLSVAIAFVVGLALGFICGLEDIEKLEEQHRLKNLEIF